MPIIVTHRNDAKRGNGELVKQLRAEAEEAQAQLRLNGAHLVIDTQIKQPGKKSRYLLDMLTLPKD